MDETGLLPPPLPRKKSTSIRSHPNGPLDPPPLSGPGLHRAESRASNRQDNRSFAQKNSQLRKNAKLASSPMPREAKKEAGSQGGRLDPSPTREQAQAPPRTHDEDDATNFLIEENLRRQKRYFGASYKNPISSIPPSQDDNFGLLPHQLPLPPRNPTLGEIIRGEAKNASKRSFQDPNMSRRGASPRSSVREIPPPARFSNVNKGSSKDDYERYIEPDPNLLFSKLSPVDLSRLATSTSSFEATPVERFDQARRSKNLKRSSSRPKEKSWVGTLNNESNQISVREAIKSIEMENGKVAKQPTKTEKDESPNKKENKASKHERREENGLLRKYFSKRAFPDNPERDSLDGNLPGSSHGTATGNPPPVPSSSPHNSNNVNDNPDGGQNPGPNGFSKGPNSKNKKHKRLKNDNGTLDYPSEKKKKEALNPYEPSKNRDTEGGGYRSKTEPYTYLWVVLSRMYGKLIVLLMLAFCLTEVLDNKVSPLMFQEVFMLYLYVGSIVAIMCIYVTVIIDNCPSITTSKENLTKAEDPESGSITSFGTLKRAHITRSKTSRTSFYLRVGALVFGLGTLIYNGLEIAMHSSIPEGCVKDTILAHPIMQALFTFLQMHFLFVNSEVIVEKFGQIARFGFMHLVATNLALWVRMVVWESASDWIDNNNEKGGITTDGVFASPIVGYHAWELRRLHSCYQNNSLGQLWSNSQPYLLPFLVQYSLIAAAVTYIMWCNVGKEKLRKLNSFSKALEGVAETLDKRLRKGRWKVDCRSASKGLFLGLLVLVGGIVILIIFFVMKGQEDFRTNLFWMCNGTMIIILSLCIVATMFGFAQIPKLSISTYQPMDLDRLLLSTTVIGVYIFAIFGMIVGGIEYHKPEKLATFCTNSLLLIQVSLQGMLVAEASRRTCTNRYQMLTKPGRQVITFLLFSNITLWVLDTFMTHNAITHEFQINFYGKVVWGVISRISLPLMILFRFHSAVILVEIWKNTYRTKAD